MTYVDLSANTIDGVRVNPMQAELFYTLLKTKRTVSYTELHKAVYGLCDGPDTDVIRNQMCYLRRNIAPLGITIETIYGKGYRLCTQ